MEIAIGLFVLYVIQAVLIYGMTYGHFEGEFPGTGNRGISSVIAMLGGFLPVIGPVLVFFLSEFAEHGLRYK